MCVECDRYMEMQMSINFFFFNIRIHVRYVHWIHEIAEANSYFSQHVKE